MAARGRAPRGRLLPPHRLERPAHPVADPLREGRVRAIGRGDRRLLLPVRRRVRGRVARRGVPDRAGRTAHGALARGRPPRGRADRPGRGAVMADLPARGAARGPRRRRPRWRRERPVPGPLQDRAGPGAEPAPPVLQPRGAVRAARRRPARRRRRRMAGDPRRHGRGGHRRRGPVRDRGDAVRPSPRGRRRHDRRRDAGGAGPATTADPAAPARPRDRLLRGGRGRRLELARAVPRAGAPDPGHHRPRAVLGGTDARAADRGQAVGPLRPHPVHDRLGRRDRASC